MPKRLDSLCGLTPGLLGRDTDSSIYLTDQVLVGGYSVANAFVVQAYPALTLVTGPINGIGCTKPGSVPIRGKGQQSTTGRPVARLHQIVASHKLNKLGGRGTVEIREDVGQLLPATAHELLDGGPACEHLPDCGGHFIRRPDNDADP